MRLLDFKSKSILGIALLFLASLMTACTQEEIVDDSYTYPWDNLTATTDITLTAQIDATGKSWASGDCLYVYGCNEQFAIGTEFEETLATFTGEMILAKSADIYAVYDPTNGSVWNFSRDDNGDILYSISQSSSSEALYGVGTKGLSTENTAAEVTLNTMMSTHEFIFANMPTNNALSSAEISASEMFATTASLNISTGELTTLTTQTETVSLEVAVSESATTAYATILPQSIASTNECTITLTMAKGATYSYIYTSEDLSLTYAANQVVTTLVDFNDLTLINDNTEEDVEGATVTLQDVTVDNTAEYDTWYVTCGSIAKAGIPTGGEMVQLLEVLKAAVESGRDITLIFSDITSVSGSLFYEGDAAAYAQYLTDVQFPAVTNCSNSHVFRDCTNLRRFSAPLMSSSNKIGNYYFAGCTSLVAVNAPDGEEGVYIPDAITAISNFVFQNCSSIPSFYGAAIEVLGNSDFAGCTSLTSLEVATTSTSLTTGTTLFGSDGTLIDLNKVALVTGTNNGTMIDLEANTWTVGDNVYSGFKSINGTEFDGAEDEEDDDEVVTATNVTLQDVTVDNTAEYDTWYVTCGSIAKAGIPTGGEMVQLLEVLKAAVESGRDITLIFSDITSVSSSLFYEGDAAAYAQYLTDVQFPAVITCSNASVFRDCVNLCRFSAPLMSNNAKIGNYFFSGCTSLVAVNAPTGEEGVYIPDAITTLGNFVFQNCSSIPSFYGAAIEVLGNSDFAGCTSLTSLEVATTSTSLTTGTTLFGSDGTLIDLNKVALVTGTNNGTMIDLEANTWTVGDNVYSGFKSINGTEFDGTEDEEDDDDEVVTATNVTLQDVTVDNTAEFNTWYVACGSITSTGKPIADEMIQLFTVLAAAVESGRDITLIFTDMTATTSLFTGNTDITVLEFPAVTTMASASTFEGCTNLRSVSADICTKFHNKCFNSCPALEYVYGPKIETLGTNLMLNCTSLKTIEVATTSTTLSTNAATLFAADNDADLSGIDLITGANNGSIVDTTDGINSWTIGDYTFTGFKSITIK